MSFTHLHLHTEYSLLDGACRIDRLMDHLKNIGQNAVAITDHGVMYGVIEFYKQAKKHGIKPIIGCEVYVAPRTRFDKVHKIDSSPHHLVLLCENNIGYQNLIALVSKAFIDGFYFKPRVDIELLEQHSEGLIALSACLAGQVPRFLMAGEYDEAKETALRYQKIFGKNNYFIEIQDHGIPEQKRILPQLIKLAKEIEAPLIASNDAHYIKKTDGKMQNVLVCIQTNHTVNENSNMEFPTQEFYVKSRAEMEQIFGNIPESLDNTNSIAERCNVEFEFGNTKLPLYISPNNRSNEEYFRELCYNGVYKKYSETPDEKIIERLEYELSIIEKMGYVDYFLIVWDFINFARNAGIPVGPGRGSGAGSIAAYCTGITGVDPLKYNLLFERFLNPERISMPDFDIDFCFERRQEVIDYVVQKYGSDHVAQIITFGTMAAKGSIRDVGRALGMGYQDVDVVSKLIPTEPNMTIGKALIQSQELRTIYETDLEIHELIDTAQSLEGMPRHASTHAAGVVITRDKAMNYVPLQKNDEAIVTQFPMGTLEELGLLKMDFLGLRTLTVISYAEKMISKIDKDFNIENIPLDDKKVFEMLSQGHAYGVFQFESAGMRQVLSQLKPESIEDLIAVISLYRPGPMDSIPTYIRNRHKPELVTYKHPLLKSILDVTYGCIVYQEQVMQIFRQLAGYSYGGADLVRRAMSKKKADVMEMERKKFIAGCLENTVPEKVANDIFNEMSSFASYAFNKSHAAAYAYIAYQTAYLKCHYTKEYMAALLTSVLDNTDKIIEYIGECNRLGIAVLPPDISVSGEGFTVTDEGIRFGLLAIKNIGRGFITELLKEREKSKFASFDDLFERMHGKEWGKRTIESLIKCGAMDGFKHKRSQMLSVYEKVLSDIDSAKKTNLAGQMNLFDSVDSSVAGQSIVMPDIEELALIEMLKMEKETTGLYITGHPLSRYDAVYKKQRHTKIDEIIYPDEGNNKIKDGDVVNVLCMVTTKKLKVTKNNETMAFLTVEDTTASIEAIVFAKILLMYTDILKEGAAIVLQARVSMREDEEVKLITERITLADSLLSAKETLNATVNNKPDKNKKTGLYLKIPSLSDEIFTRVKSILSVFPGDTKVFVYFNDTKELTIAPKELWVSLNNAMVTQLKDILGETNAVYKE